MANYCPPQNLQNDYEMYNKRDPRKHQGFFVLCTEEYGSCLLVFNHSILFRRSTGGVLEDRSWGLKAKKLSISPFSEFIGRGDITHEVPYRLDHWDLDEGTED